MQAAVNEIFTAEWRPAGAADGLAMSIRVAGRAALQELAWGFEAGTTVGVTAADGATVVTTAGSILAWRGDGVLPEATGRWVHAPVDRGDGAQAVDMIEALLAWTKSRGLIDEAASRRISRSIQMELGGQAGDTQR